MEIIQVEQIEDLTRELPYARGFSQCWQPQSNEQQSIPLTTTTTRAAAALTHSSSLLLPALLSTRSNLSGVC
jgi:hypothetical protein